MQNPRLEEAHFSPKKQAILRFGTFTAADQVAAWRQVFKVHPMLRQLAGDDGNSGAQERKSSWLGMRGL